MGSQLGLLSRSKDYTKVILYHLTFSLYALWGFKVCYIRLKWRGTSKEWLFVKMDQGFLTCFLLMIVCFFVEQKRRNVRRFWIFWLLMREGRVRKLIETKPIFCSALILLLIYSLVFKVFWVFLPFNNMRSIWVCQRLWEGPRSKVLSI